MTADTPLVTALQRAAAALEALLAVRPSNWADGEDLEQERAWRLADAAQRKARAALAAGSEREGALRRLRAAAQAVLDSPATGYVKRQSVEPTDAGGAPLVMIAPHDLDCLREAVEACPSREAGGPP